MLDYQKRYIEHCARMAMFNAVSAKKNDERITKWSKGPTKCYKTAMFWDRLKASDEQQVMNYADELMNWLEKFDKE